MKVLVIEHAPGRSDGISEVAAAHSIEAVVWKPYTDDSPPTLEPYSGLIIGGGPMGAYEIHKYPFFREEIPFIEGAIKNNMPTLGICLGLQLLATIFGGKVEKTGLRKGFADVRLMDDSVLDPVLKGLDRSFPTFQYHRDEVTVLPLGGRLTVTSDNCLVEGFRFCDCPVSAVQFHPEIGHVKAVAVLGLTELSAEELKVNQMFMKALDPAFSNNRRLLDAFFSECQGQ